jgi:hypothetical protein
MGIRVKEVNWTLISLAYFLTAGKMSNEKLNKVHLVGGVGDWGAL